MQWNPDDYEPQNFESAKPGVYPFDVIAADEGVSKTGNDMITVQLQIDVPGRDNPITVYDYLVSTPKALFKIEQFCDAVGLDFKSGDLEPENILGLSGKAKFILDKPNDNGDRYLKVKQYISDKGFQEQPKNNLTHAQQAKLETARAGVSNAPEPKDDDDIPF